MVVFVQPRNIIFDALIYLTFARNSL